MGKNKRQLKNDIRLFMHVLSGNIIPLQCFSFCFIKDSGFNVMAYHAHVMYNEHIDDRIVGVGKTKTLALKSLCREVLIAIREKDLEKKRQQTLNSLT